MRLKNENGVTLVSLIVSIIVMIILASVTLETTFNAYETTRAEKFKSQLKVVQVAVESIQTEYQAWRTDKEDQLKGQELANLENELNQHYKIEDYIEKYLCKSEDSLKNGAARKAFSAYSFSDRLKTEVGKYYQRMYADTWDEDSHRNANGTYKDVNYTYVNGKTFYKLDSTEIIEKVLGIKNIDITLYIDFNTGFVFTDDYVKIDNVNFYTLYDLSDGVSFEINDTTSTTNSDSTIQVDTSANYGNSRKIKLTLVTPPETNNDQIEYKLRKAFYKNVKPYANSTAQWYDVNDLKDCKFSEDGRSVTFVVYESGEYKFRMDDNSGKAVTRMMVSEGKIIKNKEENYEEKTSVKISLCNPPAISPDMIPVKWVYNDTTEVDGRWVVCSNVDPDWYSYDSEKKRWANIMLSSDTAIRRTALKVGDVLTEKEMGSMFVWIPRCAYESSTDFKLTSENQRVVFLRGVSNTTTYGTKLIQANNSSEYSVFHNLGICFNANDFVNGSWDVVNKGLWVSKYDMSLESQLGDTLSKINTTTVSTAKQYNKLFDGNQTSSGPEKIRAVSKPYYISWRNISFVNAFSQALMYYTNMPNAYFNLDVNSHLMKASELQAINCLSKMCGTGGNGVISNVQVYNSVLTGGSETTAVCKLVKRSSTGNITGVYDLGGTASEMLGYIGTSDQRNSFLYNETGKIINQGSSSDINVVRNTADVWANKYLQYSLDLAPTPIIKLGDHGYWKGSQVNLREETNKTNGFRVVLINTSSGRNDSYIYDNTEMSATDMSASGFYETDDEGNLLRDSSGYPLYTSWEELKNAGYIYLYKTVCNDCKKVYDEEYDTCPNCNGGDTNITHCTVCGYEQDSPFTVCPGCGRTKLDHNVLATPFRANKANNSSKLRMKTGIFVIDSEVEQLEFSDNGSGLMFGWGKTAHSFNGDLLKVVLPDSVKRIGNTVFNQCRGLKSINLPNGLETIGMNAFRECNSLEAIVIPESVLCIGAYAFSECTSMQSVTIPSNVQFLGNHAFFNDHELKEVSIQSDFPKFAIGERCFSGSDKNKAPTFETLTIPGNTQKIGKNAFDFCSKLKNLVIEEGVKEIDMLAFADCQSIKMLNLPSSITTIGERAFMNCIGLETINMKDTKIKVIPSEVFSSCAMLKNVSLPSGLTELGEGCFYGAASLKELSIPLSLATLQTNVFAFSYQSGMELKLYYPSSIANWEMLVQDYRSRVPQTFRNWYSNYKITVQSATGATLVYE